MDAQLPIEDAEILHAYHVLAVVDDRTIALAFVASSNATGGRPKPSTKVVCPKPAQGWTNRTLDGQISRF